MVQFSRSKGITTIQLIIIIAIVIVAFGGVFFFTRPLDNSPPVSILRASSTEVEKDGSIIFSVSDSSDTKEDIDFTWDFGDGGTGTGENVTHIYSDLGNFTIELTMTDKAGTVEKETISIEVTQPFLSELSTIIMADPNQEYQFNASNGIKVVIPKYAVPPKTTIEVKNLKTSFIEKPPWSQKILNTYDISSNKTLIDNIYISFPIPDSGYIGLGHFHEGKWELLDFIIDEEKAIVETKELSVFSWIRLDVDTLAEMLIELATLRVLNQGPTFQFNEIEILDQDLSLEYIQGSYMKISENKMKVKIFNIAPLALDVYPSKNAEISYKPTYFDSEESWGIIIPPGEYGEWIFNTDDVRQVTLSAYVGQRATAAFMTDLIPLHKLSRSLFYDVKYIVLDGKSVSNIDFFKEIIKHILNKALNKIPKILDYFTKMGDILRMESFEVELLSIDFTRARARFLVENGNFEDDYFGEHGQILGWDTYGVLSKRPGLFGDCVTLGKWDQSDSYITQMIDFEVQDMVLTFWLKPTPQGSEVSLKCYLDFELIFNETYQGVDDDFMWEKIEIPVSMSIGFHELKFLVEPYSWGTYSDVYTRARVWLDEISFH